MSSVGTNKGNLTQALVYNLPVPVGDASSCWTKTRTRRQSVAHIGLPSETIDPVATRESTICSDFGNNNRQDFIDKMSMTSLEVGSSSDRQCSKV